jgi:methylmalonyl-CoA mutase
VLSVDPSKRRSGGALLGDRIRMNAIDSPRVYMRSLATRQANLALSRHLRESIDVCRAARFDLIVVETSGIGQSDTAITDLVDLSLYVMTAEYGAATQLEKIDMIDFADVIAINKFDKRGSLDALRDVRKQLRRNRNAWEATDESLPVFGTMASQFNDPGTNALYRKVIDVVVARTGAPLHGTLALTPGMSEKKWIIPPDRTRYLAEIAETCEAADGFVRTQSALARRMYQLQGTIDAIRANVGRTRLEVVEPDARSTVQVTQRVEGEPAFLAELVAMVEDLESRLDPDCRALLREWPAMKRRYAAEKYQFQVRDKVIEQDLTTTTLSGLKVPKVALPAYEDWGDVLTWLLREAPPGIYPFTAGVFPLKREGEDPARMFAGEGGPSAPTSASTTSPGASPRSASPPRSTPSRSTAKTPTAARTSTARSATPASRWPRVDDAKKLYSGFDLADPGTSVSMTINGPAPMVLGFFLNAAVDQQCEKFLRAQGRAAEVERKIEASTRARAPRTRGIRAPCPRATTASGCSCSGSRATRCCRASSTRRSGEDVLQVRGTVQADILKEDQAQNTCIFSTEFALRMMGDIQQFFIDEKTSGTSTRCRSAATTSPRPGRTPSPSSPSRWRTASPSSSTTSRGGCTSTTSRPTSRSSSRTGWTPSTPSSAASPGASGPARCATSTAATSAPRS